MSASEVIEVRGDFPAAFSTVAQQEGLLLSAVQLVMVNLCQQ
jgi:hypothetical protein